MIAIYDGAVWMRVDVGGVPVTAEMLAEKSEQEEE